MSQQQTSNQPDQQKGAAEAQAAQKKPEKQRFFSLYVGNLPEKSFFDLDLQKIFEQKGYKVKSATV